jgi:hypothetical protein
MLAVAGSGLIGRYIYTKIHYKLYGSRVTLDNLRADAANIEQDFSTQMALVPELTQRMTVFEESVLGPSRGFWHGSVRVLTLSLKTRWTYVRALRLMRAGLKEQASHSNWSKAQTRAMGKKLRLYIKAYLARVRKVAELSLY